MSRTQLFIALAAAIVLQFFVLTGMVVKAAMPLYTGTEIRVRTLPVDPRSLFRGNYARLNYEFSRLPDDALRDAPFVRAGEVVYVSLTPGADGLYEYAGASLEKPTGGLYLRGRVVNHYVPYRVRFGIEAFFAPKKKALQLESDLRDGGVALLMISGSGRVALKDVTGE